MPVADVATGCSTQGEQQMLAKCMEHCKACAEERRRCEQACQELLQAIS